MPYIPAQYENYLKGTKAKYKIVDGNKYELVKSGKRGNDIVLTIDIELQKYLEERLISEVLATKMEKHTKYYDHSFAIVSNPKTGVIDFISIVILGFTISLIGFILVKKNCHAYEI